SMEYRLQPGPVNPEVLTQQETHRSKAIWDGDDKGSLRWASLRIGWLTENFSGLPEQANEQVLHQYVRAYLLILMATVMFPDKSGNDIQVVYLPLLRDLTAIDDFSWGSVVLATLYRNLCRSSNMKARDIGGPLILLQLWAWERITIARPIAHGFAEVHMTCNTEIQAMPQEVPPHYRNIMSNIRDNTFQSLEHVGYSHLLQQFHQPTQETQVEEQHEDRGDGSTMQESTAEDDETLEVFRRRSRRTNTSMSPINEEGTPEPSKGKRIWPRLRGKKKT
ncbi:hypothetical protein KSS87_006652, partial [Heliosperma pusillum]